MVDEVPELDPEDFAQDSFEAFNAVLNEAGAELVKANATQYIVDCMVEKLSQAYGS